MKHNEYPLQLFWSEEDDGFVAVVPDLPGASAIGASPEEALAEVRNAITAWIDAAHAAGNEIPAPSPPSFGRSAYAGKVALRMPSTLHERATKQAATEGTSLNLWLCSAIAEQLGLQRGYRLAATEVSATVWEKVANAGVTRTLDPGQGGLVVPGGKAVAVADYSISNIGSHVSPRLATSVSSTANRVLQ